MCFSAAASFTMGAALLGGGGFSVRKALEKGWRYLPLALMPVFVGIQQSFEGLAWIGLHGGDPSLARVGGLGFLFFTWMVWPLWIPIATFMLEPDFRNKILLGLFIVTGAVLGPALYLPYFQHPDWLSVSIAGQSIGYETTLLLDPYVARTVTYIFYLGMIGIPPVLSTHFHLKIFGLLLLLAVPVTHLFYLHAAISVLCFFAAGITLYLIFIILGDKCSYEDPIKEEEEEIAHLKEQLRKEKQAFQDKLRKLRRSGGS